MKFFSLISLLIALCGSQKPSQEIKLEGRYKMVYESEYSSENCTINIKGLQYEKRLNNGSKRTGHVSEEKLKFGKLYILKDNASELQVAIHSGDIGTSDTIYFRTKKIGQKDDTSKIIISSGQLIRLK